MRPVIGMASAGLCVMALGVSAGAQALTSVPDDAILFVRVKNLEEASKKIGALMQDWGVAEMQPMLADPLAALEGMSNLQNGLNRGGEAAIIFFNPMVVPQGGQPMVIMLPVADYAAFLGNFDDADAQGEITEITMPMSGEAGYVTHWGGFAAISPTRQLLAQKPRATRVEGLTARQLADRDVTAYLNFQGFRDQVSGYLAFGRMAALGQLDQNNNVAPEQAKYRPLMKAAMGQLFNGLDHFINETRAITVGADFAADGVSLTIMTEFEPDTYLGILTSNWKTPESKLGAGLPEDRYVAIGTSALDSASTIKLFDDMTAPVLAEAKKLGDEAKPVIDYIEAMKEYWKAAEVQSFGLQPGSGAPGESPLFDVVAIMHGDAAAIVESQSRMAALQNDFSRMLQMPNTATTTIEVAKGAKVVDGVSFDQMLTKVIPGDNADDVIAQQNIKMMEMIYGKGGFSALMGTVNDKTVLVTSSRDDAAIGNAIKASREGQTVVAQAAGTSAVAAKLPQKPIFSMFIYGDQLMNLISRASEIFAGTPIQTQIAADTPPLGVTVSTEGSAVRYDYQVPSPLVKALVGVAKSEAMKDQQ